jgi:hypothetical protein
MRTRFLDLRERDTLNAYIAVDLLQDYKVILVELGLRGQEMGIVQVIPTVTVRFVLGVGPRLVEKEGRVVVGVV